VTAILKALSGGADRVVVIDTETTGVYNTDRIVEIALVTMSLDGEFIESYDTLIHPQRDVSATFIHGITASMVQSAPTFEEIAGDIAIRLNGACLVAHNLPFDYRMVRNEFERLGEELMVTGGLDTLSGSGCRLGDACALHGIPLDGAHRALTDATATAQLLLRLIDRCGTGAPAAAPIRLLRSGRVLRRDDTHPEKLPDPPYIVMLTGHVDYKQVEAATIAYLDLVERAVADLHLDREEREQLAQLASELGLDPARIAQAHRRFVFGLVEAALEDHVVTSEELDTLLRVAHALDVEQSAVELRIEPFMRRRSAVTLVNGMTVVITGDHAVYERSHITERLTDLGLEVVKGVNKTTELLAAADVSSSSGKAKKARKYGIPIVSVDDLLAARLGSSIETVAVSDARKVVSCPDCYVTWTVSGRSSVHSVRRCDDCAPVAASAAATSTAARPSVAGAWAPPTVEWLVCEDCGTRWHRQVTRGRKPRQCLNCR